jgi:hypothetical protein
MPPEAREFVDMLLNLTRFATRSRVLEEVQDELLKRGPEFGPLRRQFSETENVGVFGKRFAAM